eukprot:2542569-Amphidinium_carterae.1
MNESSFYAEDGGEIAGTVTWTEPSDVGAVDSYRVYLGEAERPCTLLPTGEDAAGAVRSEVGQVLVGTNAITIAGANSQTPILHIT